MELISSNLNNNNINTQSQTQDDKVNQEVYNYVSKFARAQDGKAWFHLITTLLLYIGIWTIPPTYMFYYIFPLTALMRVRFFVIFHDMGHLNYFSSPFLNKWIGTILGAILAYTPYSFWIKGHNYHHKNSNNLDKLQYAQTSPWTKQQFDKAPRWKKIFYTVIYGPLTFWTIIPILNFIFLQRLVSTWYENLFWIIGFSWPIILGGDYMTHELLLLTIGPFLGVFLFHVQHTFDGSLKRHSNNWDYYDNAIKGSSYFKVPRYLKWFTFGIEYHHIHHLNSKVPSYRLQTCHEQSSHYFDEVHKVTVLDAFKSLYYSLYNENTMSYELVYNSLL